MPTAGRAAARRLKEQADSMGHRMNKFNWGYWPISQMAAYAECRDCTMPMFLDLNYREFGAALFIECPAKRDGSERND